MAILAFRSGGQARAFRIAFAAVGGGYLLLVLCNTFTPIRDLLVTNRALVLAGQALHVPTQPPGYCHTVAVHRHNYHHAVGNRRYP